MKFFGKKIMIHRKRGVHTPEVVSEKVVEMYGDRKSENLYSTHTDTNQCLLYCFISTITAEAYCETTL